MFTILPKKVFRGKEQLEILLLPAIVVLVGLGAFGLGRLSVNTASQPAQNCTGI